MSRSFGVVVLVVGFVLCGGMAQPEQSGDEPRQSERTEQSAVDRQALRDRLERAIERGKAMLARHQVALERLEAGESPADVMSSLRARGLSRDVQRPTVSLTGQDRPAGPPRGSPDRERPGAEHTPGRENAELTPELRRQLRQFLRENLPSVEAHVSEIEGSDRQAAQRLFERLVPQLREIMADTQQDPAYGALKLDEMRAGLAVVDATQQLRRLGTDPSATDARAEAEQALRQAVGARFDSRMRLREHELERLALRLSSLHAQIREEQASKDVEIDRIVRSVMSQRWTRPTEGPGDRSAPRP